MRLRFDRPGRDYASAEIALAERRYDEALDLMRRADQLPDGPVDDCASCAEAVYARIFDLAGRPDSAIIHFVRYVDNPTWSTLSSETDGYFGAAALKRLGELYEARGDRGHALARYRGFVELWKNADPELQPAVTDVRRHIARLSAPESR